MKYDDIDVTEEPTVYTDFQAEDECRKWGWTLIQPSEDWFVISSHYERLAIGKTKPEAVTRAMRDIVKNTGRAYSFIPPWERRHALMNYNTTYQRVQILKTQLNGVEGVTAEIQETFGVKIKLTVVQEGYTPYYTPPEPPHILEWVWVWDGAKWTYYWAENLQVPNHIDTIDGVLILEWDSFS